MIRAKALMQAQSIPSYCTAGGCDAKTMLGRQLPDAGDAPTRETEMGGSTETDASRANISATATAGPTSAAMSAIQIELTNTYILATRWTINEMKVCALR